MDLKAYHDRHGDLVSAERASNEGEGVWARGMSFDTLPDEVIEGMPAGWLERHFGEETARQASFLSPHLILRFVPLRVLQSGNSAAGQFDFSTLRILFVAPCTFCVLLREMVSLISPSFVFYPSYFICCSLYLFSSYFEKTAR